MKNKQLFTSISQDWTTPKEFYDELNKEFDFDFDPCPSDYTMTKIDGLNCEWGKRDFVNPPYKSNIQNAWVKKAFEEYKKGKLIVLLIPARTDTIRFHNIILPHAKEIRFIKGRLHFSNHRNPATFPSMVVIFDPKELKAKLRENEK